MKQLDDEAHELNHEPGFDSDDKKKKQQHNNNKKHKITSQSSTTKLQRPGDSVIIWLEQYEVFICKDSKT